MAMNVVIPKKDSEINRMVSVANLRKLYIKLSTEYKKIIKHEDLLCPKCGNWKGSDYYFYHDDNYVTGRYPICKQCLLQMVEQRDERGQSRESVDTVKRVLRLMDKPFVWTDYDSCVKSVVEGLGKKQKNSAFASYITMVQSLPQYKGKTWENSIFAEDDEEGYSKEGIDTGINENSRLIKAGRKRFGYDYELADLQFLESQYEDWVSRYECQTKAQEEIFERLAFKKWEINKATKAGAPTKDLDRTYQDLLSTANITPKQTGMDAFAEAQTLGTLIQKWEESKPLPEIDPELKDVDKIGTYIDVFFKGHTSRMLGIKNSFSNIYEKFMSKYTVKPPEYEDDDVSESIFNKVFGNVEDI